MLVYQRVSDINFHTNWCIIILISSIFLLFIWLVVLSILKNMKVNGKDDIPYMMENKKWLTPPTSYVFICFSDVEWLHSQFPYYPINKWSREPMVEIIYNWWVFHIFFVSLQMANWYIYIYITIYIYTLTLGFLIPNFFSDIKWLLTHRLNEHIVRCSWYSNSWADWFRNTIIGLYGDGSKPYPPGEHQNSW